MSGIPRAQPDQHHSGEGDEAEVSPAEKLPECGSHQDGPSPAWGSRKMAEKTKVFSRLEGASQAVYGIGQIQGGDGGRPENGCQQQADGFDGGCRQGRHNAVGDGFHVILFHPVQLVDREGGKEEGAAQRPGQQRVGQHDSGGW